MRCARSVEWITRPRTELCEDRRRGEPTGVERRPCRVDRRPPIEGRRLSVAYAERTIFDEFVR